MVTCEYKDDTYYNNILASDNIGLSDFRELDLWEDELQYLKCGRSSVNNEEMCVYHLEPDVDSQEEKESQLISDLSKETNKPLVVIEGNFDTLVIGDCDVNRPVLLSGSTFNGSVQVTDTSFNHNVVGVPFLNERSEVGRGGNHQSKPINTRKRRNLYKPSTLC